MGDILTALKYRILYWLELPIDRVDESRDEIVYLRNELTISREEISRLVNLLYNSSTSKMENTEVKEEELEPIRGKYTPWPVRRAQLERDDRLKAESFRKEAEANKIPISRVKSIEELENELEVKSNDAISNG